MLPFKKISLCAALAAAVPSAWACPSCQCGDYTLTLMGVEKSYAGRTRVALDYQNRSEYQGAGLDRTKLEEARFVLSASYAFSGDLSVALRLPYSFKSANNAATPAKEQSSGLGDADIAVKYTLGSIGEITARHLWGVQAGLRFPTSKEQTDVSGTPIDIDAQPGTGAWAPSAGIWYGYFRYPQSVYVSVTAINPDGSSYQGLNQAAALLATVTGQYAITQQWTAQLGVESRFAGHNEFFDVEDPDSGGTAAFVVPGIVWSPHPNWLIHVSGQVPLIQHLHGEQDERGDIRIGVAFDLPR